MKWRYLNYLNIEKPYSLLENDYITDPGTNMVKINSYESNKTSGQTLMEILIGIGVAGIILTTITSLLYVGLRAGRLSREREYASRLIQDMSSGIRGLVSMDWRLIWGSSGIVGYWGMNEGVQDRVYEPVSGNTGILINSPIWQSSGCIFGKCLSFNGSNQYLSASDNINYSNNAFTVSAWIKPNNITTCRQTIVSSKEAQGAGFVLAQPEGACNKIRLWANINGVWQYVDTASTITTGQWYHVAGTFNGSALTIYLNSIPTTASFSGTLSNASGPTTIGARNSNDQHFFNGLIDEVRIYNRALDSTEIQQLYQNPQALHPRSIGGLWAIYEGKQQISSGGMGTFVRWYIIDSVLRQSLTDNTIVSSGGIPDPSTVKITYYVTTPSNKDISFIEYVTRSQSKIILQTDWSGGPNASGFYITATNLFATSTNINYSSTTGQIRLKKVDE
jgi:hypothetical protein